MHLIRRTFVVLALFAASAASQAVHVVAGDGSGDFTQLQDAVDAAADGDVILVRPHTERYDATTIDAKSLSIVGDGDVRPGIWDVRVRDLAADDVVTLRGLDLEGGVQDLIFQVVKSDGLILTDAAGTVWLEDLVVVGASGIAKLGGSETAERGLVIDACERVVIVDSKIDGGRGAYSVAGTSRPGGDAVVATASRVALHGCTVIGGRGGPGFNGGGGQGGTGIDGTASTVFVSGSLVAGGPSGIDGTFPSSTPTAPGLTVRDGSFVPHLDTLFVEGNGPAPPGIPIDAFGTPSDVVDLGGTHRALTVPAPLRELESAEVVYRGEPGDLVLVVTGAAPAWLFQADAAGVRHVDAVLSAFVLGTADARGELDVTFTVPRLPPGVDALVGYAQPVATTKRGDVRFGAPSVVVAVRLR